MFDILQAFLVLLAVVKLLNMKEVPLFVLMLSETGLQLVLKHPILCLLDVVLLTPEEYVELSHSDGLLRFGARLDHS